MVNAFLKSPVPAGDNGEDATRRFVKRLLLPEKGDDNLKGVGGFSLLCGVLRPATDHPDAIAPLAILSNRTERPDATSWVCGSRDQTYGLSNTTFNTPYPKVTRGKTLLAETIQKNITLDNGDQEKLITRLLDDVLSDNTMPARKDGQSQESYLGQAQWSIFIPAFEFEDDGSASTPTAPNGDPNGHLVSTTTLSSTKGLTGKYGTQKQTVVLVDWAGKITYLERTLWDEHAKPVPIGQGDRRFEFVIEGWEKGA
jgi:Transport and Golgi organisation 2